MAEDLRGLYVGGAVGEARVEASNLSNPVTGTPPVGEFDENHSAYKAMVGLRPTSLVGAEIAYFDFGHPSGTLGAIPDPFSGGNPVSGDVTIKGSAAFGILFLPVPIVDVYAKFGVARLDTTANSTVRIAGPVLCTVGHPLCQFSMQYRETNTGFAAGAGAQYKLGSWAVRAEYERFNAAGEHPNLLSLGFTWTFW